MIFNLLKTILYTSNVIWNCYIIVMHVKFSFNIKIARSIWLYFSLWPEGIYKLAISQLRTAPSASMDWWEGQIKIGTEEYIRCLSISKRRWDGFAVYVAVYKSSEIWLIYISTVKLSDSARRSYWTNVSLCQRFIVFTVHN